MIYRGHSSSRSRPYHDDLDQALQQENLKLGVDCHSMAAVSPPIESDAGTPRPLICLGNLGDAEGLVCKPFHRITSPPELVLFMRDEFRKVFQVLKRTVENL